MTKKLRVGIIGASVSGGWASLAHVPGFKVLDTIELKAVATTRQETADASAQAYGAERGYGSFRDLIADDEIDLVSVVVRVPSHYEPVMAALEAGKPVYCEWPLGANLQEAEEMTAKAVEKGILSAVGMQGRMDPTQRQMKQLIADGYVGEVLSCSMTYFRDGALSRPLSRTWQRDVTKGATTLTIYGGHAIDTVSWCVGEFASVSSRVVTRVPQWRTTDTNELLDVTAPDNVLVSGELKNGAVASVHVALQPYHGQGWRLEVWGRDGVLVATTSEGPNIGPNRLEGSQGGAPLEVIEPDPRYRLVPASLPSGSAYNIAQIYSRMAATLVDGEEFTAPTFADALKHHRLLAAIQRSSDEGRAILVD